MTGDALYLKHIEQCIARIESYTREGKDCFLQTRLVQDAVIRNFEIIGEAANRLSATFRTEHAGIPWRKMIAFRNLLIHEYFGVNPERVWQTVVIDLPKLKTLISLKRHD